MMPMGGPQLDPLQALAALASGQQQPQGAPQVADPLTRALEYAKQQQAQIGEAPGVDAAALSQQDSAARQQELAAALMNPDYVQNSGALGALAQTFSAFAGAKMDKKAGESMTDAMTRIAEQQRLAQEHAGRIKAYEEGPGKIAAMAERSKAVDYKPTAAELASGEFAKPEKAPTSAQEFDRAQRDPAYAKFLEDRRPKGTSVNVSMPAGQKAFEVELGKADAQTYVGLRDGAMVAQESMRQLGDIEQILKNAETGKVNEALAMAGQYFGTEAGADLQTMRSVIVPLVLSDIKKLGVNPTDKDLEFINQGLPGFGTDPRANKRIIDLLRKGADARIKVYQEADEHIRSNDSLRGWSPSVPMPKQAADPKDDPLGIL